MDATERKAMEMAEVLGDAFIAEPPRKSPKKQKSEPWRPNLGPIGIEVIENRSSQAKFLYGERGSLKSGCALHDLIVHCYQDFDPKKNVTPLAVICTIVRSAATEGGAWEKLFSLYLPEWFDGIGLDFTEPRQDDQKNRFAFIGNKHGTWSRVILKSIPYGESIRGRMKGVEASYFFFDEITETDDPDYYLIPSQSLRRPTGGPRQYVCAGNPPPQGTEHWTWDVMVQGPTETSGQEAPILPEEKVHTDKYGVQYAGGKIIGPPERDFAVYHMPLEENVYWSLDERDAYRRKLMQEARLDPTAEDRIIKGLWTARPTGAGLFKEYFVPNIHVKGDRLAGKGLLAYAGYPIIVGYDLGQVYSSVGMMQAIPVTTNQTVWPIFDEIDHLGQKILYKNLAREVIERLKFWRSLPLPTNNGNPYPFKFIHVTDDSAINQWRPNIGSYDATEFEKAYEAVAVELGWKRPQDPPIKLLAAPKGDGSVAARIRLLQSKLYQNEVLVSATCPNTRDMLMNLEAHKDDPDKPKRSKWLHIFDRTTYPMHWDAMRGGVKQFSTEVTAPSLIRCGSA